MIAIADEKPYKPEEIGQMFDREPGTIRGWIRDGKLAMTKVGGSAYVRECDLLRMLEAQ